MARPKERTAGEKLAYTRGFYAGTKHEWSMHKPPQPPNTIVAAYMNAATELRNAVQSTLQTISDDDEWALELWPKIDALDSQTQKIIEWLRTP